MINGDIFISPIDYALLKTLEEFENKNDETSKTICSLLNRSRVMWETIRIHGLNIYGMSYDEFCEQCEKKRNILFLSDEEVKEFNKVSKIVNAIKEIE